MILLLQESWRKLLSQRLLHIRNDIVNIFDANRETNQIGGNAGFDQLLVGH